MGKTVTAQLTSVYDTLAEYTEDLARLEEFEATEGHAPVTNKVLDLDNLTISFTITQTG